MALVLAGCSSAGGRDGTSNVLASVVVMLVFVVAVSDTKERRVLAAILAAVFAVGPPSWRCHAWKAARGYSGTENTNREKERIWFSPHCLNPAQGSLFAEARP